MFKLYPIVALSSQICIYRITCYMALVAGAAKYTHCVSVEGYDSLDECPVYGTKQTDCDA